MCHRRRRRRLRLPASETPSYPPCELVDPGLIRAHAGYATFPILDASIAPPEALIARARTLPPPTIGALLIHCAKGHGRTGMFAATWLMVHGFASTADEALSQLVAARPELKLRRKQRAVLDDVQALLATEPAA